MKRLIAILALALFAFPASALAVPDDLRLKDPRIAGSALGIAPDAAAPDHRTPQLAPHLPAIGTDAAAPDQQSPVGAPAPVPASSHTGFDWGDAGIGAGSAICLLALASAMASRRRRVRRTSMATG